MRQSSIGKILTGLKDQQVVIRHVLGEVRQPLTQSMHCNITAFPTAFHTRVVILARSPLMDRTNPLYAVVEPMDTKCGFQLGFPGDQTDPTEIRNENRNGRLGTGKGKTLHVPTHFFSMLVLRASIPNRTRSDIRHDQIRIGHETLLTVLAINQSKRDLIERRIGLFEVFKQGLIDRYIQPHRKRTTGGKDFWMVEPRVCATRIFFNGRPVVLRSAKMQDFP